MKFQCKEEGRAASAECEAADCARQQTPVGQVPTNRPQHSAERCSLATVCQQGRRTRAAGASRAGSKGYSRTSLLPSGAAAASTGMVML